MEYTSLTVAETHAILWIRGFALPTSLLSFSFLLVGNFAWLARGLPEAYVPLLIPLIFSFLFNATIFTIVFRSNRKSKIASCPPRLLVVPADLALVAGLVIGMLFAFNTMVTFVLAIMVASLHLVATVVAFIAGRRGFNQTRVVEPGTFANV